MKKDLTEIIFILDRSGSMNGLEKDTIGGYNVFLDTLRQTSGEAQVTTVLFDDKYEILHNGIDIKYVKPIGKKEYFANSAGDALFQLQEETSHLKKTHDVKPATANITELERQKACMVFIFVEFYETKFEILKRELYASSDLFISKLIC